MTSIDSDTIIFKREDYASLPRTKRVISDGVAIDISVGHQDADGRQVTRVDLMIDDETRGFGDGDCWVRDGARIARLLPGETDLPGTKPVHAPLTADDVWTMGEIIAAVQDGKTVHFLREGDHDEPRMGTLRHLVRDADTATFLTAADDVRDALIRITLLTGGAEVFMPLTEAVELRRASAFAIVR